MPVNIRSLWSRLSMIVIAFTGLMARAETLLYNAEWRLMDAGRARITYAGDSAKLSLETIGIPGKLYRVKSDYSVSFNHELCAQSASLHAEEGSKRRQAQVTYHSTTGKADYIERDMLANKVVRTAEVNIPACVHDVIAGLLKLRGAKLAPGQTTEIPISDGRKSAMVRVVAEKKETIKTPAGVFPCIRVEAFLFNNVIYRRKAKLLVWIAEDARRLPVQIRVQMPFYLGTVTLQLEKEEQG